MKRLTCIGVVLLVLCACGDGRDAISVSTFGSVHEIFLSDGTRCAVYRGYRQGGITCDWDGPKAKPERR